MKAAGFITTQLHAWGEAVRPASVPILCGSAAGMAAKFLLTLFPSAEISLFAQGAARLAGLLTGSPVAPAEAGWLIPASGAPVVVTTACSATDFFWIVAACLGWQWGRSPVGKTRWRIVTSILAAPFVALLVTILVNALRVVAVAQMHRWVIPHFPKSYDSFLHLFTGVTVFLPALIGLSLLLEAYGRRHSLTRA